MDKIVIKWETTFGSPTNPTYYINDSQIGVGNEGFNKILEIIKANKGIKVVLQIEHISSLGGDSLLDILPFKDRFNELEKMLGTNKLIYEFI